MQVKPKQIQMAVEGLSPPTGTQTLTGSIQTFIYQTDEFAVATFLPEGQEEPIKIVGPLIGIGADQTLEITGEWGTHPTHGPQLRVTAFHQVMPTTVRGIAAFLSSGLIRHVGPVMAERIAAMFAENIILSPENRRMGEWANGRMTLFSSLVAASQILSHSYAITIHKSQGSEYPVVVVPVTTAHYTMLTHNLYYKAITRATKLAVMIGSRKALRIAVGNNKIARRWTGLARRLGN